MTSVLAVTQATAPGGEFVGGTHGPVRVEGGHGLHERVGDDDPGERLGGHARGGVGGDRVDIVLVAPHTPTGMTAEALTGIIVADALVQAVATVHPDRAVRTSHELTAWRGRLGH